MRVHAAADNAAGDAVLTCGSGQDAQTVASRRCLPRFQGFERTTLARTWWSMVSHVRYVLSRQDMRESSNFFSRRTFRTSPRSSGDGDHLCAELRGDDLRAFPGVPRDR